MDFDSPLPRKPTFRVRRINRILGNPAAEKVIARLPKSARLTVMRKRYGWGDWLFDLQHHRDGQHSLIETEAANAIFIHIPKAAGLSLAQSLFGSQVASHTCLYMYLGLYGQKTFDNMFKFTFVRNPWHRITSAYYFLKSGGLTKTDAIWARQNLSQFSDINDFVERGLARPEIFNWVHFRDQMHFLRDPRTGTIGVDFVGRFENLAEDFETVRATLGLDANLPHTNKGPQKTHSLTPRSIEIIRHIYSEEIDLFGYEPPPIN